VHLFCKPIPAKVIKTFLISEQKNPERVAAGLKATLHNPTVSAEAKSRAQARLKEMGVDPDIKASSHKAKEESKTTDEEQPHDLRHEENVQGYEVPEEHRILGGYKATLKSSVLCWSLCVFYLLKYIFTTRSQRIAGS
jgi:hypothetical protein